MRYFHLLVTILLYCTLIVFYMTFLVAYLDEGKSTRIYIDKAGEATVELVLLSILLFAGGVLIISMLWRFIAYEVRKWRKHQLVKNLYETVDKFS